MKRHFNVHEVADLLNCSVKSIYRLISDGQLIAFRLRQGGSLRIPRNSVDDYIKRRIINYQLEKDLDIENFVSDEDK